MQRQKVDFCNGTLVRVKVSDGVVIYAKICGEAVD